MRQSSEVKSQTDIAAVTQAAECRSSKPDGVGSIPTRCTGSEWSWNAAVAQVAERRSRKAEVAGSWPACGSWFQTGA